MLVNKDVGSPPDKCCPRQLLALHSSTYRWSLIDQERFGPVTRDPGATLAYAFHRDNRLILGFVTFVRPNQDVGNLDGRFFLLHEGHRLIDINLRSLDLRLSPSDGFLQGALGTTVVVTDNSDEVMVHVFLLLRTLLPKCPNK